MLWSPDFPRKALRLGAIARTSRSLTKFTTLVPMLILLPPSEGKTAAPAGCAPVDLLSLSFPELTEARERVGMELQRVSQQENVATILKVGKTLQKEIQRNQQVLSEPAQPASEVYSGVLYDALDYFSLSPNAQEQAENSVLIISALWGVLRLQDSIPAYRLSMGVNLGDRGNLATFWRGELTSALQAVSDQALILDCRSAAYAKAWVPAHSNHYLVRVEKQVQDGARKVISHFAKHYRGLLTRHILTRGLENINSIDELEQALSSHWTVEVTPATAQKSGVLTLVVKES